MKNMMRYKGYYGSVDFDPDEPIFYGKVEFIKALLSYESNNAKDIKKAFEQAVDDYLELCESKKIAPEKAFKGSFNVRTGHQLHEKIALVAQAEDMSINKFICITLDRVCTRRLTQ